jgi:hypothetical protein
MSNETLSQSFSPNEFYERLIVLRDADPVAFMGLSGTTHAALRAYEEAKKEAGKGGKV